MECTLKNGELAVIRPPRVEDAEGLIELMQRVNAETRFLARGPGEFQVTVEKERAFIEGVLADENGAWFTAEVGGRIVGNCSVGRVGRQKRFAHRANLSLSVEQAHWGLGIGSRFMECAIGWCADKGVEQLELEVAAGNAPGIGLYKKYGFVPTGSTPRALKYEDGTYDDLVFMVKRLDGEAERAQSALERLSREQAVALNRVYAKNWLALDGVWFQAVERQYGMDAAMEMDAEAWRRYTVIEARRIKEFLGLPERPGLEGLRRALELRCYANLNRDEIVIEGNVLTYRSLECRVQTARARKNMPYHPCKPVGEIEYAGFARAIDDRLTCECLSCYPDVRDDSCSCAWRFTLNE